MTWAEGGAKLLSHPGCPEMSLKDIQKPPQDMWISDLPCVPQECLWSESGEGHTFGQRASIREGDGLAELSANTWNWWIESQCLLDAHGGVGHLVQVLPKESCLEVRDRPWQPGCPLVEDGGPSSLMSSHQVMEAPSPRRLWISSRHLC